MIYDGNKWDREIGDGLTFYSLNSEECVPVSEVWKEKYVQFGSFMKKYSL